MISCHFLIGMLSNTTQAGLYAKAFSMATFPVMLTGIFARLTVPLYTRYQFDREEMKKIFVNAQGIKMILLIPTQLAMGLFAHLWIPKLFGAQWLPMIPIYQMMTVYGIARAFFDDVPAIYLYGLRQPWVLTKSQILQSCIILLLGPLLVLKLQAFGGACAISAMLTIAAVLFWRDVFLRLGMRFARFCYFFCNASPYG
jgi:O-antigen/teichoic acid export membrane protein